LWHFAPELCGRVLLVDKDHFPREKICAGAIGGRADRALGAIGVNVEVPSVLVHGLGITTRMGALDVRAPRAIGRVVRRVEFDQALLDEVRARGIEVRTGVRVEGLRREPDRVVVQTSCGPVRARALVGADGVGSKVRKLIGLARGSYYAQAIEVDTVATDRSDVLSFELLDPSFAGYGWTFPTLVGGERKVCRGVYRLTRGAPSDGGPDVARVLGLQLQRLGIADQGLVLKRFAERGLAPHEPCAAERVLLVGEAAGIDPVLGEGIAQAILYGRAAGQYLARCAARAQYGFGDWRDFLRRSRVGLDLRVRAAAVKWIYGSKRLATERWLSSSEHLARVGMSYFAGERVPRSTIARAAVDLARVTWARW
jgi:flavin-dependent dehydrogenase